MTESVVRLKSELGALPVEDRAELAHFLIESLDDEPDQDTAAAWEEEVQRRVDEIESGQATGRPVQEVLADLRRKYP